MRPFAMPAACRLRIGIWTSLAVSMLLLPWAAEPVASAQGVDLHAAATTAFSERFSADLYGAI